MKNQPFSSESLMPENRKVHKRHWYTKSHVKDKDAVPSYQYISSRDSIEIDNNFQCDEKPPHKFLETLGPAQRGRFWKEGNEKEIKNEN